MTARDTKHGTWRKEGLPNKPLEPDICPGKNDPHPSLWASKHRLEMVNKYRKTITMRLYVKIHKYVNAPTFL